MRGRTVRNGVAIAAIVAAVGAAALGAAAAAKTTPKRAAGRPAREQRGATATPAFGHVVVIVFENREAGAVLGSSSAPTFNTLERRYAVLDDYVALAHPSLPNYLALVSGSTQGITSDCTDCAVRARNLADTLEAAGKTWKTYAEGLPVAGFTGAFAGRYAKKHNPLLYFRDVLSSAARLRRIVPFSRLARDLAARTLPDFSLIVPDLCHDMHDCSVATGDTWLSELVPRLLKSPQLANGVIFVVFDEGARTDSAGGGGHVPALVLGPLVHPDSRSGQRLDHYGLLRTIEDGWRLPRLGASAAAAPVSGIWRRR